jgi:hypothetical protein
MVVEIEGGVFDPVRIAELERALDEAAPKGSDQVHPLLEHTSHHLER